jgi:hypothetical protein
VLNVMVMYDALVGPAFLPASRAKGLKTAANTPTKAAAGS